MTGVRRHTLAMRGAAVLAATAAIVTAACGSAQGTHRQSDAPLRGSVVIVAHAESNKAFSRGTWAWTPDVGSPVIAAWKPSAAASKITALAVGDVVTVKGELAGTYQVTALKFDGRKDHDLYLQAVGPRYDNRILERVE